MTTLSEPPLGLHDHKRRVSRTAAVTARMFDQSDGLALAAATNRVRDLVEKHVEKNLEGSEIGGRFYYVTYEVVLDDGAGTGRPMRPPVAGQAANVVLPGMPERMVA